MGLHAQIHQLNREVTIALSGQFRRPELTQLQAILTHFHDRGCQKFVLDLRRVVPLTPSAQASLDRMIGQAGRRTLPEFRGAIRLLADSPAAQPQTGCGGLTVSAA